MLVSECQELGPQAMTLTFCCVVRLQEKHNREKLRDHLKAMVATQEELKEVQKRVKDVQRKIKDAHSRQERLLSSSTRLASK